MCVWVGERVRGYVWFTRFAVLLSGPMVLSPLDDGALRSNWIHVYCCTLLLYQRTAVALCWVGGSLGGCVHGFVLWVGRCVGSFVVDCVVSFLWVVTICFFFVCLFVGYTGPALA